MKVLAIFLFTLLFLTDPTLIGKVNSLKSDAKKAYLKNDFQTAAKTYKYLIDSLQVREDEVMLNLASAYYNLKDTANALSQYQSLTQSPKNYLRSKAQQQLGLIADQQGKSEEALNYFKQAIKSDLTNQEARYNYELLKKKLEEQKKQDQKNQDKNQDKKDQKQKDQEKKDQQNKDEKNKDQQQKDQEQKEKEQQEKEQKEKEQQKKDQEKKDKGEEQKEKEEQEKKEQEKKDMPPSVKEKLEQMQISEEKAKMLLEAMRAQEVQYLQQNKRKATKPKEKGKPDW